MIINIKYTYPEKLGKMEGSMGVVWNSQGRRKRIKFSVELAVRGMGIGRMGEGWKEQVLGETARIRECWGGHVKTYCINNLESMRVTLARTPSEGGYRHRTGYFCSHGKIAFGWVGGRGGSMEILRQGRLILGHKATLWKLTTGYCCSFKVARSSWCLNGLLTLIIQVLGLEDVLQATERETRTPNQPQTLYLQSALSSQCAGAMVKQKVW